MPAPPSLQRLAEQSGLGSASGVQLLLVALASLALARLLARFLSNYLRRIAPPPAAMAEPAPEPVMCGELTLDELRAFDGSDPSKPLYLACLGVIYDVTKGKDFYGPDGPYNKFAGREANRALAKMSLKEEDCVPDAEGLSLMEQDILKDWKAKFETKYTKVGTVKR